MGAWSRDPFGNDIACDWSHALLDSKGTALVESALDAVLENGAEYLEADQACEAVAAVEVLAKLLGKGTQTDAYTEEIDQWVKSNPQRPDAGLLRKARAAAAIDRILANDSELCELWEESDDSETWKEAMAVLRSAVSA